MIANKLGPDHLKESVLIDIQILPGRIIKIVR